MPVAKNKDTFLEPNYSTYSSWPAGLSTGRTEGELGRRRS